MQVAQEHLRTLHWY